MNRPIFLYCPIRTKVRMIASGLYPALAALVLIAARCAAQTAPTITSLSPNAGLAGTQVTITGSGFGSAQSTSTVTFNGTIAVARGRNAISWSDTGIVVAVPAGATSGNVVVKVGGQASNSMPFSVGTFISSISPTSGSPGTLVTVNGAGFGTTQGSSTITFNGVAATSTNWSDGSIAVLVPSGTITGNIVVTVGGVASNGLLFTVAPFITTIAPTAAAVGTPVTITGGNFGASQGTSTVTFNSVQAAVCATCWSPNQIVTSVPQGATTGPVVLTVAGAASNGPTFTVTPRINSLSMTAGPPQMGLVITGTNFGSSQGNSAVMLSGTTMNVSSWSNTAIIAQVPTAAASGNFSITVSVGGQASNGSAFTVITPFGCQP